jgi:predicted membrane-bound spermidine synthase
MAIFALSGFSGLIYQSIWSHYLGLTLGHAAYAQTLVLAIFMGGLAIGAWLASRVIRRLDNAILGYAGVELAIGLFALVFHPLFLAYSGFSQYTVLPELVPRLVHAYKGGTAALLILPQCVLLGTTFPLMASACIRLQRQTQGRSLGGLYFSNSLGAAMGALAATFLLLPWIGMPGAMAFAGAVNLLVALLAWSLSRAMAGNLPVAPVIAPAAPAGARRAATPDRFVVRGILFAAAITGATSFVYEIVWVRMLNMALGTTLHSFELMLAAFILGLAAGGWWIHRRGDRTANPLWLAGIAQLLMGVFALASALAFGQSFGWVAWLVKSLPLTEAGYAWFNLGSATVALLVMFPAAFFAGSTLPLFTLALLRRGEGERAIGWVYAANTLGAIAGVFAVVHLLIPLLGLHLSLLLGAAADIALGVVLIALFGELRAQGDKRVGLFAGVAMFAVALLAGRVDPLLASSGAYRSGYLLSAQDATVRFLADGKTATVAVLESPNGHVMTIATNGKPDAGLAPSLDQPPRGDEVTMAMGAALPLSLHPSPREVGAIGWGSGLTTHSMLGSPRVRRMETIEIEPKMVLGARLFGSRVARAYTDPRSEIVFEDARTYLSAARRQYDVLVSEPSNPWVSGVASLFTDEFYRFARGHVKQDGLFVQWIHLYEMRDDLLARMVSAMRNNFAYVDVYLTNDADLLLVGSQQALAAPDWTRLGYAPLSAELARIGLHDASAFEVRRIGGRKVLDAFVRMHGNQGHSDFYPVVALGGARARFMNESADLLPQLVQNGMPVLDMLDGRRPLPRARLAADDNSSSIVAFENFSGLVVDALADPAGLPAVGANWPEDASAIRRLQASSRTKVDAAGFAAWCTDVAATARYGPGALATVDLGPSWIEPTWLAAGQGPDVVAVMAAYRAAAMRDAPAMRARATAVLDLPVGTPAMMREQMLAIAMAGAAAGSDRAAVARLERKYAVGLDRVGVAARVRGFMLSWAALPREVDPRGP